MYPGLGGKPLPIPRLKKRIVGMRDADNTPVHGFVFHALGVGSRRASGNVVSCYRAVEKN